MLLLSRFSSVWLCATPWTAAHQAPPSLGFSRQEHWSRLPFPSPMLESEKWKWSRSAVSDSATPWSAAHQAPPSMWFYRQEHWSGCHCLLPKPHRPGEYEVPVSTGFSVVTKRGHKVAASLPAPLLGFLLFCFLLFIFCSSRVDFRCVCFKCTGTWFSCARTYLYSLSGSFPILVLSVCSVDFPVLFRYFGLSIW